MSQVLVLVVLIASLAIAQNHTASFTEYWAATGNNNHRFFHPGTFGADFSGDAPCQPILDNRVFRAIINAVLPCQGLWCQDAMFKCPPGDSRACYNVEHIIDQNGKEFPPELTNIAGNMVMAWGQWNQENGRLAQRNYQAAQQEKVQVYSKERVANAKALITKCASNQQSVPTVTIAIMLLFVAGCVLAWIYHVISAKAEILVSLGRPKPLLHTQDNVLSQPLVTITSDKPHEADAVQTPINPTTSVSV